MTDDIEVPIIEICDGWTVDDIFTEDDCDDAFAVLTAIIVQIEARMDDLAMAGDESSIQYKKAKSALRWKKAALNVVNTKRGQIRRKVAEDKDQCKARRIIKYFAAMHPKELKAANDHIAAGTVDIIVDKMDASND